MNLSVGEVIEAGKIKQRGNGISMETEVTSVVVDSRLVTENGVFYAIAGERTDGHSYLKAVCDRGAALVIGTKDPKVLKEEYGFSEKELGKYAVTDVILDSIQSVAEAYRKKLTLPIIGITGSVGKTSTKEFVAGVLAEKYSVLKTDVNQNNQLGVALTLLRIRKEHEVAVVEMGISKFGEMHRLSKMVRPNLCVMTNIGDCHLENLGDRDGVLRAKSEIFDFMAENGTVILCKDDEKLAEIREIRGKKPLTFGLSSADVFATELENHGWLGTDARLCIKENGETKNVNIHVPLPGKHMVLNAAAAACVATVLHLLPQEIANGIEKVKPVDGRTHLIKKGDTTIIDDCYNANPASMRAALELLRFSETSGCAVLGDMFELGENEEKYHAEIGRYAMQMGLKRLICVGKISKAMENAAQKEKQDKKLSTDILYFESTQQVMELPEERKKEYFGGKATILLKASHGMNFAALLKWLDE